MAADFIHMELHRLGVDVGQDQREGVGGSRFDGREDGGERDALVGDAARALAALPPDMAGSTFLTNPRLVLEEDADALFSASTDRSQDARGVF